MFSIFDADELHVRTSIVADWCSYRQRKSYCVKSPTPTRDADATKSKAVNRGGSRSAFEQWLTDQYGWSVRRK